MNTEMAREKMVEQQVRAWEVFESSVLDVLGRVPRENFVPPSYSSLAFADTEIPIGHGQTMMTPTVEGRMLQSLALDGGEHVLEIGTGSGFVTACLAALARRVTSIDIFEDFLDGARDKLDRAGIDNVRLESMDAMQELPGDTFDAIAVTGSMQYFDPRLVEALKPGGRVFVIVGDAPVMDARVVTRVGDSEWTSTSLFETELQPLINAARPPRFSF